jgi:hypothetical protein
MASFRVIARFTARSDCPAGHLSPEPCSCRTLDAARQLTKNKAVPVRKLIALALTLSVQAAALTGPLVHAHPDDSATEHHGGRTVHTHWASHAAHSHPAGSVAIGTADHDRAVFVNAFIAVAVLLIQIPDATTDAFELFVPAERAAHRGVEVVHSHDPPFIRTRSSRAPPPFLS